MAGGPGWTDMLRRLRWDLLDRKERFYYGYWLIWQVPGLFGNMLRARYLSKRVKSAGANFQVMAGCRFRSIGRLEVGDNVTIGYDNFIQALGGLRLGNNVSTAPGVKIWTVNHDYGDADRPVQEQGQTEKPTVLEEDVFVGSNAFIMPGAHLGRGCIVTAGAVVGGKAYRPYSILSGNPARVMGYRGGHGPGSEPTPDANANVSPGATS